MTGRRRAPRVVVTIALAVLCIGAAACGGGGSSVAKNKPTNAHRVVGTGSLARAGGINQGGTLRVGFSGTLVDLDPQTSQSLADQQLLENVYRGLTRLKSPTDPTPEGDVASSWTVSSNQLSWTFKLRPGVKFQDGKPVTAADVVYSMDRIMNPKTVATLRSDLAPVKRVVAVDPHTVRFDLKKPYSILPIVLQTPAWAAIVPKGSGATLAKQPNGTGPFAFDSQVRNTSLTLKRFPGYWEQGEPHVSKVVFTFLADENARVNALRSNQVDLVDSVPFERVASLQGDKSLSVVRFASSWVDELGLNTHRKPFSDVRVRQAIAHALNRAQIAKVATFGLGDPMTSMVAPTSPIKVQAPSLSYNPGQAKKLLAAAGYAKGFSMSFSPCGGDAFPAMRRAGEVIVRQLAAVGIKATQQSLESGVWADKVITKHDYDGFICGLVSGNDPDQHTYRYFHSGGAYNFSLYQPPAKLDQLLDRGRGVANPAQRSKIYDEAWTLINRDAPWIALYNEPGIVAARANVRGFQAFPEFNFRLESVGFAGT
jgi:peptide/nickel transport system substrate-binding protein